MDQTKEILDQDDCAQILILSFYSLRIFRMIIRKALQLIQFHQ